MPDNYDRRTVLQAAGGALAGSTMLAGRAAGDEIKPLNVDVKQEAVKLGNEGVIPVRVTVSEEIATHSEFPGMVYFGVFDQFVEDGETLYLTEESEPALARPVRTTEVRGRSGATFTNDMLYDTQDIDFSGVSTGETEMGLGFFPDGIADEDQWDTDEVGIINGII